MVCQTLKSEARKCLKSREARAAFARAELAICVKITMDGNFYTGAIQNKNKQFHQQKKGL